MRGHQERHDGLGFPDGLRGEAIPVGARILAVADTFDDLQCGQLSRAAVTIDEARVFIGHGRYTQFDSSAVDACLQVTGAPEPALVSSEIAVQDLLPGMVLANDLCSREA